MIDIDPPAIPKLEWSSSDGITHAVLRCYGSDHGGVDRLIGEFMDVCEPILRLDVRELELIHHCDLFGLVQLGRQHEQAFYCRHRARLMVVSSAAMKNGGTDDQRR